MNVTIKSKDELDTRIIVELKKFKKNKGWQGLSNVGLNQHITKIIQPFVKPHDPVRTSFEYTLFLSVARNTPTHLPYVN